MYSEPNSDDSDLQNSTGSTGSGYDYSRQSPPCYRCGLWKETGYPSVFDRGLRHRDFPNWKDRGRHSNWRWNRGKWPCCILNGKEYGKYSGWGWNCDLWRSMGWKNYPGWEAETGNWARNRWIGCPNCYYGSRGSGSWKEPAGSDKKGIGCCAIHSTCCPNCYCVKGSGFWREQTGSDNVGAGCYPYCSGPEQEWDKKQSRPPDSAPRLI